MEWEDVCCPKMSQSLRVEEQKAGEDEEEEGEEEEEEEKVDRHSIHRACLPSTWLVMGYYSK